MSAPAHRRDRSGVPNRSLRKGRGWGTELPPPSDPDPDGAAAVQELMGGRFGEMSTFMNYTFQSFNFRNKRGGRPFYDLVANIAAEEFGHIELVAATLNSMLTGASPTSDGDGSIDGAMSGVKSARNVQHFIAGGHAALPQDSNGRPWTGDNVFSSGDLIEDLTHKLLPRNGRAAEQAAGLRDGRPTGGQGPHGLPALCGEGCTRSPTRARSSTSPALSS